MSMETSRRSLFKGILATGAASVLPSVAGPPPSVVPVARALTPFAPGNTDSLTEMLLALLDERERTDAISVIRSVASFRIDMLDDIRDGESVADSLTRNLGEGQWSEWDYSVEDIRSSLITLDREEELKMAPLRRCGPETTEGTLDPKSAEKIEKGIVV